MLLPASLYRRDVLFFIVGAAVFYVFGPYLLPASDTCVIINNRLDRPGEQRYHNSPQHNPLIGPADIEPLPPPPDSVRKHQGVSPPKAVSVPIGELAKTAIVHHAPGWTLFKDIYMANGTLFVITDDPSLFPERRLMISTGLPGFATEKSRIEREPTDSDLTYISRADAKERWGTLGSDRVHTVEGNTVLVNEPSQFLGHYYHFVAELFFGIQAFWHGTFSTPSESRSHSAILQHPAPPPLDRLILARTDADGWRDKPGLNAYFLHAAFPSLAVEDERDWKERISATWTGPGSVDQVWHFPTLLLTDRSASFRTILVGIVTNRIASESLGYMQDRNLLMGVQAGGWWEPVRAAVVRFAGVEVKRSDMVELPLPEKVVITYVSRQGTSNRKFTPEHHAVVLQALKRLAMRRGWEFNELTADMSREQQIQVAARTTVLVGIHGNGLSHLVFMPPTKLSAVVEIFNPPGFAHDYEWTARALGMAHYAIHYDRVMTYPDEPQSANMGEDFHSDSIPVDPGTVVKAIEEHVAKTMM